MTTEPDRQDRKDREGGKRKPRVGKERLKDLDVAKRRGERLRAGASTEPYTSR